MNIPIIYEDDSFVVINKPAGITVNRAETTREEITLQDWAAEKFGIADNGVDTKYGDPDWKPEDDFYKRGGIVHRLDKETSGVLIIARTPDAFVQLQQQFRERQVQKTYLALSHGKVTPTDGEISVPVGRLPWNRKRFGVLPGGRDSKTSYTVKEYYQVPETKEVVTMLELYPQSGRTHQIRVHLRHINHPIFADLLYAGRKTARSDRKRLSRVFLHAAKISFTHPVTQKPVQYDAPLAPELNELLQSLQKED